MTPSLLVRALGALSAILLVLGATGPLAKALLMTAYLSDVSPTRVTILIVIAGAALVCSILGRTGWLAVTALLAIGTLGSMALGGGDDTYIPIVSDVLKFIGDILKSLLTDFAKAVTSLKWGAFCLVGGIVLMLGVGLVKRKY